MMPCTSLASGAQLSNPVGLTPPKLPWPARTIAEAMPEFTEKRSNQYQPRKRGKGKK